MDNLTHTLTGVLLGRTGLERLHKRAGWLLVIGANAPDCDVVSLIAGWVPYLFYHRWYTHALLVMPLMALVTAAFVRLVFRKEPFDWVRGSLLALIGVASHLLLDYTNAYGIRLLLPFSDAWPRLSTVNVIDIWIWLVLLSAVTWPFLSRLVSDEIGAKRTPGRGWAVFALSFVLLYNGVRFGLHQRAVDVQMTMMVDGATPRRAFAIPRRMNPLVWRGVVETDAFYAIHDVDLGAEEPVGESRIQYKPIATPAIEAAARTDLFRVFSKFSAVFLWRSTPDPDHEGATLVEAIDLQLGFTARASVAPGGEILSSSVEF